VKHSLWLVGVPDGGGRRPLCWRLLLNFLPPQRTTWTRLLDDQRRLYAQFVDEMVVAQEDGNGKTNVSSDHPLNPDPDSKWQGFFKDNEVLLQVRLIA
jgi:hypothetical protein